MLHRRDIAVDSEQRFGLNIHELAARGAIRDTKVLAALADPPEARMKTGQIEKRYGLTPSAPNSSVRASTAT
jgi:hypothetical protein